MSKLLGLSIERDLEEFDIITEFGGVEDRLAIDGPNWDIAAPAMEVCYVEEFGNTFVAAAIRKFL